MRSISVFHNRTASIVESCSANESKARRIKKLGEGLPLLRGPSFPDLVMPAQKAESKASSTSAKTRCESVFQQIELSLCDSWYNIICPEWGLQRTLHTVTCGRPCLCYPECVGYARYLILWYRLCIDEPLSSLLGLCTGKLLQLHPTDIVAFLKCLGIVRGDLRHASIPGILVLSECPEKGIDSLEGEVWGRADYGVTELRSGRRS